MAKEVRTKIAKDKRVLTGIKQFDRLIGGGFLKNSMNLLVGGSGVGKSIFGVQFLVEGIKNNETCLYITFEEKKEDFFKNIKELGWNLEEMEKQGRFIFLEYSPEKVKTMLEEGGGAIETTILTKKINRIVIDSMTAFAMLFDEEYERREAALSLFRMLRKWSCTALLTYERDPLIDKKSASRILEFESDSIIMLYSFRGNRKRDKFLEIIKMRGTNHSREIYPYKIDKSGIIIESTPYTGEIPSST